MRRARRTALTAQTGLRTTGSSGHSRTLESAYLALRHTLLDGPVLRPGDRPGIEQELWALLTLYQPRHHPAAPATATAAHPPGSVPSLPPAGS